MHWLKTAGSTRRYEVLFLQGGASTQFYMAPLICLPKKQVISIPESGCKCHQGSKYFGEVVEVASSKDKNYNYIPKDYTIPTDIDYLHITTNNTIFGTQIYKDIDSPVQLVADMSSDIFSRPIDISKYALIYAGAQKNLAPAGVTLVIVRKDALGKTGRPIPTMINYMTHIERNPCSILLLVFRYSLLCRLWCG